MHGNVWERCQDDWYENYHSAPSDGIAWYDDSDNHSCKLSRGGSWNYKARHCRSAGRTGYSRVARNCFVRFRVLSVFSGKMLFHHSIRP